MRVIPASFALAVVLAPITVLAEYKPTPPKPLALASVHFDSNSFIYAYARGPLALDVVVKNNTASAMTDVKVTSNVPSMTTATVSIPANGSTSVHLIDTRGLASACAKTTYGLTMTSGASSYGGSIRLSPVCALSVTTYDPWDPSNGIQPAMVHDHIEPNSVFARNMSIVGPIECGKTFTVKFIVYNKTTTNAPQLDVGIFGDNGYGFGDITVSVPAGGSTPVELLLRGDGGYNVPAKMLVQIADMTGALKNNIKNQGLSLSFGQVCQVNPTVL